MKSGDRRILPILWDFWDFRVYVMGMGHRPMGLTHVKALF
jgi:hypothetical protein